MKDKILFGKWEGVCLLLVALNTQIFLNLPRSLAESGGTAGWILALYISIITFVILAIIIKLYSKFNGKDLLDLGEVIAGNTGRTLVGTIIILYLIYIISVVFREFSENMKIISLDLSPISFVSIFFIVGMIIGAYIGIEALVRFAAIAVPIILLGFIIILIGVSQFNDLSRIMPILGLGPKEIFLNGATKISIFSGLILLFLMAPFIKTHIEFRKIGYTAQIITSASYVFSTLIYLLVYQYPTATENFLPIYQLARLINYGRFFQRIESVFVLIWATSAFLYLSLGLFLIVYFFKKTFRLTYYKPLIIPFAVLIYTISFLPSNLVTAIELETKYFRVYSGSITFGLTILLLILAGLKKKTHKKGGRRSEGV